MSFLGSVGKIFSKVVKGAKRVGPEALAIGAIAFTVGAALGLPGLAGGGWGNAVEKGLGALGLGQGTLGRVLAGAVTQAGYGAALGAGTAFLSGGSASKGAQYGAAAGALTGAATGGLTDLDTDPLRDAFGTGLLGDRAPVAAKLPTADPLTGATNNMGTPAGTLPSTVGGGAAGGTAAAAPWYERNQGIVGGAVGGIGQGLLALAKGEDEGKAAMNVAQNRQSIINANYGGAGSGLLGPQAPGQQPARRPEERFDPANYGAEGGKWIYDPAAGRIRYLTAPA
ncbi:MAG: hypothetical protein Q7S17_07800 [Xanthobacteraceae bacterium]|nr:hypothetical protein [Xanthobacteraceae bacterium]